MYRASAIALANTISDLPFSAARILLFNIIVYFLAGMHPSAGAFFTFHLFTYVAYLSMQGFFRTFGLVCSNFDAAFRLATFFIPNLLVIAPYSPTDFIK
jgi:ATP-binding cassette subfamily G (WHITE) protein 2 (SNQ2)